MDEDGRVVRARTRSAVKPTLLIFKLILNLIRGRAYSESNPDRSTDRPIDRASERASERASGTRRGNKIIRTSSLDKTPISERISSEGSNPAGQLREEIAAEITAVFVKAPTD
jgi:hypothetical protein